MRSGDKSLLSVIMILMCLPGSVSASPTDTEGSLFASHEGWAGHLSLLGTGVAYSSGSGRASVSFTIGEVEGYYKVNLGGFLQWSVVPFVWKRDAGAGDINVPDTTWAIGPVYALPVGPHCDLSLRAGLSFHQYTAEQEEWTDSDVCGTSEFSCTEWVDQQTVAQTSLRIEPRVSFPVGHYRPAIAFVWDLDQEVTFDFSEGPGRIRTGPSYQIVFHLVGLSSEKR